MEKINAAVVGITGYTGMELMRIIGRHPGLNLCAVTSRTRAGQAVQDVFPYFQGTETGLMAITVPDPELVSRDADIVFLAVPHGKAMELAAAFMDQKVRVVDLSADFRLRDPQLYEAWYNEKHQHPDLLEQAVYGIPELYQAKMAQARLTANPGCYPTSVILAMYPALEGGYISGKIIADSKSGVSGAGRSASVGTLFCEVADSFKAYSTAKHRHTPEMEQELSRAVNRPVALSFSPHLVPMSRGILSTCYADLAGKAQEAEIREFYKSFYKDHPWVRIMPQARLPETRWVKGTMYCDLGLVVDQRTNTLVVVSCIDNLCRGASGQAVANANIMCGYQPGLGLDHLPLVP